MTLTTITLPKKRRVHGNSSTSKANKEIEETLIQNLVNITNRMIDRDTKESKSLLSSFVSATFRESITNSYLLGIKYLGTAHPKLKTVPSFITSSDVERVKQLSESYSDRFWNRITKIKEKEKDNNDLVIPSVMSTLSIGATNEALNLATVTKARKFTGRFSIGDISGINSKEGAIQFNDLDEDFPIDLPLELELTVQWVTAEDGKVCPICEALEGEYNMDDIVPQPIESSHPNCRCRLLIEGA